MERRCLIPASLVLAGLLCMSGRAGADDALIDVGATQTWILVSPLSVFQPGKNTTIPATGITARWMFVDGHGEVSMGGRLSAWKPLWDDHTDSFGIDVQFMAMFGGRFKGRKAHVMPCGGFGIGLRNMLLEGVDRQRLAISGIGLMLHLGVHGYFGRDDGFYWRLAGLANGHLLFPDPGWTVGGGVELTIGIYLD